MKRIVIRVAALVVAVMVNLFSPSVVYSLDLKGRFALSGQGGLAIPIFEFDDERKFNAKFGFGFGGAGEYFVSNNISLGGTFRHTVNGVNAISRNNEADWKINNFGAFVRCVFPIETNALPYGRLGVGFYKTKFCVSSGGAEANLSFERKFGLCLGAGIMFPVGSNVLLTTELVLHSAMLYGAKADIEGAEVELLADAQYLTLYAGITFLIGSTR